MKFTTEFKTSAYSTGQIMAASRSKSESLSKGAQTFCKDWMKEQIFGRRKSFTSKYTTKGLIVEDEALDTIAIHLGLPMLLKNEKKYVNDYMKGIPDSIHGDTVFDAKSSWDWSTFPLLETVPDKAYFWQGQVYMALTGLKKFKLCYVLLDTPDHIIVSEARRTTYLTGENDSVVYERLKKEMTYSDVAVKERIKIFDIAYDAECEAQIIEKVLECRKFIEAA
jgi:hypothetical protein